MAQTTNNSESQRGRYRLNPSRNRGGSCQVQWYGGGHFGGECAGRNR